MVFFNPHTAKSVMLGIKLLICLEELFSLYGTVQARDLQMSFADLEGNPAWSSACKGGRPDSRTLERFAL